MRRASILAAVFAASGGLLLADAASAQSDPRRLSWPGRGDATPPQIQETAGAAPGGRDLRRPNRVIPHGGLAPVEPAPRGLTPAPGPARRTLTPANAWLQPPPPAPEPAPPQAIVAAPPPPPPRPGPEYLADQGGRGQPAPADVVYSAPPSVAEVPAGPSDPMAPRRDALIFQIQQGAPPAPEPRAAPPSPAGNSAPVAARAEAHRIADVANSGERPPQQGARYYSVHRQNGREPDPLVMPEPTYVDALVVSMAQTPASQDLAAPERGPTLIRDRNGNMRAAPAPSDGDHQ